MDTYGYIYMNICSALAKSSSTVYVMQMVTVTFRLFPSVSPIYWYLNSVYSREIAGVHLKSCAP